MGIGELVGLAIFGLIAGAIARLLHPGRDPMNWLWTMALGIGGSLFGGWLGGQIGIGNTGLMRWVLAVGGAILLLILYNSFTGRRAATPGRGGAASSEDYKKAVFDDLSRGPNG